MWKLASYIAVGLRLEGVEMKGGRQYIQATSTPFYTLIASDFCHSILLKHYVWHSLCFSIDHDTLLSRYVTVYLVIPSSYSYKCCTHIANLKNQ